MHTIVMTFMGEDRPGIVERLSETAARHEASWLESRMAHLGGFFAGILRLEVAEERSADLIHAIVNLEGLEISLRRSEHGQPPAQHEYRLEVVGQDRVGIVSRLSHVLAGAGVNIEEMRSEQTAAPMSGIDLFTARARLGIPEKLDIEQLCAKLNEVGEDLMVEIKLSEQE